MLGLKMGMTSGDELYMCLSLYISYFLLTMTKEF